ncbi:MAG: 3-dehydroquinate synthase [Bacteroides sp.]|nr:3-dehydroquinate synthase [Bacteroides sp.]
MNNLTTRLQPLLEERPQIVLVTDSTVGPLYADKVREAVPALTGAQTLTIPAGIKDLASLTDLWRALSDSGMTRKGVVVNLGGGTVTDIGGFAAATFKRGVSFINVPTTLLAMADASVGGKTGIDFNGLKNEVGAFAMPEAVVVDPGFLRTLPPAEILSGFAEMLKTGLVADAGLYTELLKIENPSDREAGIPVSLIERTVAVKEDVTRRDPHEKSLRKILNFGHTAGHAYESRMAALGRPVPHGVAVAWGLLTELVLSHFELGLDSAALYPYARLLREQYPPFPFTCGQYDPLLELMAHDKKNSADGRLNFTLIPKIGEAKTDCLLPPAKVRPAIDATLDLLGR